MSEINIQNTPTNNGDRSNQEDNTLDISVASVSTEATVMNKENGSLTSQQKSNCSKASRKRANESESCSDNSGIFLLYIDITDEIVDYAPRE